MPNNAGIYNAVVTGCSGSFQNIRWISENQDYTQFRNSVLLIADIIDSKIPTQALSNPEFKLMQRLCMNIFATRYPPAIPQFNAIANAIVELWTSVKASLEPENGDVPLGSIDGQILYWDESSAQAWEVTDTGPSDTQLPFWTESTNKYRFSNFGTLGDIQYFDTTHSPVGLWNFNETLADISGNGNDITLGAGNLAFAAIAPGKFGLYVLRNSRYQTADNAPELQLTGDMTGLAIVQRDDEPRSTRMTFATYTGTNDAETQNRLYWFGDEISSLGPPTTPLRMFYGAEHGAGIDDDFTSGGDATLPPVHNIEFVGFTRINNVIRFYLNGRPYGPDSGTLATPTGGTAAVNRFCIGSNAPVGSGVATTKPFIMMTLKIIGSGLSDAEVLAEYNRTMGPAFGVIS